MSAASTSSFPFLESAAFYALALNGVWVRLWDYRPAMPTVRLGREPVGARPGRANHAPAGCESLACRSISGPFFEVFEGIFRHAHSLSETPASRWMV